MADKLTIEITTAVSQALAGLKETADAISKLQAATVGANAQGAASAVKHEGALQNLWMAYRTAPSAGALLKDVGVVAHGVANTLGTHLQQAASSAGSSIKTHLVDGVKNALSALNNLDQTVMNIGTNLVKSFGPLIGIAAVAAIGIGLQQVISKTIAWDDEIAKLTRELNGNVEAASTWAARAEFVGIGADQLSTAFVRLGVAIMSRPEELAQMGVAVSDANGNLRQTTDVLQDLVKWFQLHRNSIEASDEATKLFGRGNAALAALLGMTTEQFKALDAEAKRLGLIIGPEQLGNWRAFDAEVKAGGFAVQGLELALGHGLMPIFSILASAIGDFVTNHMKQLVAWLATATGWVVGFISVLTGTKFAFSDFAHAIASISSQVAELGTIQDLSGAASKNAANATKAQTQAINNQIDSLRQANQLLQEQTDAEIALLQAQGAEEAYLDQQAQSKQRLAADSKAVAKLRSDYEKYLMLGDLYNAQNVYDQLTAAQQTQANDQQSLDRQTSNHARTQAIDVLKAKQKVHNDETNDLITQLQNRLKAIAQADTTMLAGAASTAQSFTDTWAKAGDEFAKSLDEASVKGGKAMAENIKKVMAQILVMLDPSDDPGAKAAREKAWGDIGRALGKALMDGMRESISIKYEIPNPGPGSPWFGLYETAKLLGFQAGGTVPGPIGAPKVIVAHGGERVVSNTELDGQRGRSRTGLGSLTANFYIYGATDAAETARVVRRELNAAMGLA